MVFRGTVRQHHITDGLCLDPSSLSGITVTLSRNVTGRKSDEMDLTFPVQVTLAGLRQVFGLVNLFSRERKNSESARLPVLAISALEQEVRLLVVGECHPAMIPFELLARCLNRHRAEQDGLRHRSGLFEV